MPVVAFGIEPCIIVDFTAGDVLHDHDFPAREILIDHGGRKPGTVFVVSPEPHGVLCFVGEVHLLLGAGPEFIQDHIHVHDRGEDIREFQDPGGLAQKADVLLHFLVDTGPLHFYDHHRPVLEPGFVDLGNGGRTQGRFVYACEHLVQIRSIGFRQDLLHGFKGHGFDIRPEFFQFAAVALGENVLAGGHDLADFHIGRAKVFQDLPELHGIHAPGDFVFLQNPQDLAQPPKL